MSKVNICSTNLFLNKTVIGLYFIMSEPMPIQQMQPNYFSVHLTNDDIQIMNVVRKSPSYITSMENIMGYRKGLVANAINANVVKFFRECGVEIFGTSVRDAKVLIPRWLDEHPACKDRVPERCFWKILYWLAREWHLTHEIEDEAEEIE